MITLLVITILGTLAILGIITPSLGWIAFGLGVALGAIALMGCCTCSPRCFYILPACYLILIGVLGGAGVISGVGLGWTMVVPALICIGTFFCGSYASTSASCYLIHNILTEQ